MRLGNTISPALSTDEFLAYHVIIVSGLLGSTLADQTESSIECWWYEKDRRESEGKREKKRETSENPESSSLRIIWQMESGFDPGDARRSVVRFADIEDRVHDLISGRFWAEGRQISVFLKKFKD
jgi:hypothetical protein